MYCEHAIIHYQPHASTCEGQMENVVNTEANQNIWKGIQQAQSRRGKKNNH